MDYLIGFGAVFPLKSENKSFTLNSAHTHTHTCDENSRLLRWMDALNRLLSSVLIVVLTMSCVIVTKRDDTSLSEEEKMFYVEQSVCVWESVEKHRKIELMREYVLENTASHFTMLAKPLCNHLSIFYIIDHKGRWQSQTRKRGL